MDVLLVRMAVSILKEEDNVIVMNTMLSKMHGKTKTLRTSINIMMMKIFQFKKEKKQDLLLVVENVPYVVEAYNFFFRIENYYDE